MAEWTEGVCEDGAAILRDGVPVSISDVLAALNDCALAIREAVEEERAACAKMIEAAPMGKPEGAHHVFGMLCELADAIRARSQGEDR